MILRNFEEFWFRKGRRRDRKLHTKVKHVESETFWQKMSRVKVERGAQYVYYEDATRAQTATWGTNHP